MAEFVTQKENTRRIAILVFCIVASLASAGWGGYCYKRIGDLRNGPQEPKTLKKVQEALEVEKGRLADLEQSFMDFSKPVGWRLVPSPARPDLPETPVDVAALQGFLDDWWETLVRRHGVSKYVSWKTGGGAPLHIPDLLDELERLTQEKIKETTTVRAAIGKWDEEKKEGAGTRGDEAKALADQKKMEEEEGTKVRERLAEAERLRGEMDGLVVRTQDELKAKQDEKNASRQALSARVKEMYEEDAKIRAEIAELQARVDAIVERREQAEELKAPDGRVIHVDASLKTVYLNIGRSEGLYEGTPFEVFGVERGGKRVTRGEVKVVTIDELFSRAQIVRLREGQSIRAGDFVYNGFYDAAAVKKFVLAGRFVGPYTKDELSKKIEAFGERYSPSVTKDVNYCAVGEGYETDPVYLEAQRIGVKVIREKTLLQYLGIRE